MQIEHLPDNDSGPSDTTVTMESSRHHHGAAYSASSSAATVVTGWAPARLKYRFWAGEMLGVLFVLATTLYIVAMPIYLTRPALIAGMLNRWVKRTLDIVGASVGLALTVPFWPLIALIIKIDSPGPVFYTQTRIATNRRKHDSCFQHRPLASYSQEERRRADCLGTPFKVVKFRTMTNGAEQNSGPVWAVKSDPRITRVGAILRSSRLDEVPQFLNVLRGEMALVGPRPERPTFVAELATKVDGYALRLDVKPGITGLAQIENGYDDSIESVIRKVQCDLRYINDHSIWKDIKILLRTVAVVVTGRGAC